METKSRIIYGLLYNFSRAFLDIIDSLFFIITVGYYSPGIANIKCMKHSRWASNVAKKLLI